MKAKSIKGKSHEDIQTALKQSLTDGFKPTLAFVFISIKQNRNAVCEIMTKEGIDIIGATSSGEFINGYQSTGAIVVLLLEIPRELYTIYFKNTNKDEIIKAAEELALSAQKDFNSPAFIICSTAVSADKDFFNGELLVKTIEKAMRRPVTIVGGMAGDDLSLSGTFVFTNTHETNLGFVALVLNEEKISIRGMAMSGWKPFGTVKTITKCEEGWVYTIDNQPALEMYLRYLGKKIDDATKILDEAGLFYPFQMESESNDGILRTPIGFNKELNALQIDIPVPQGSKFRFSMPPDFEIVETVIEKAKKLKDTSKEEAEALLIFSCVGRYSNLGPMAQLENDGLSDLWKVPMAGFFTYGEYGITKSGKQEFHSTTCSWVALKEL